MGFKEDLAAAKAKPRRHLDTTVELDGKKHVLRFFKVDGVSYSAETLRHPVRPDIAFDRNYGYDITSLAQAIAPEHGRLLVDGEETVLSAEDWADLFAVAAGGEVESIVNTVYALNEFASSKAVDAARKVLSDLPHISN